MVGSEMIATGQLTRLLDEEMTDLEIEELEVSEEVCRRFMAWDMDEEFGDVKTKMAEVLKKSAGV